MNKIIVSVLIGVILLTPLIFPNSFAQEDESMDKKGLLKLEGVEDYQIIGAFVISAVFISTIAGIFKKLSRKPLGGIILNSKGFPTLSKFQFLLWTLVIAFSYFSIQIILIVGTNYGEGQNYTLQQVPENLLALMGISVAVPVINASITEKAKNIEKRNSKEKFFGTMFYNPEGNVDLARLQMFLWTIIGISIYLYIVFDEIITVSTVEELFIPDISPTLLVLMGLSQSAYLGSKIASRNSQNNEVNKTEN